jgi:hypothetical protein
MCYNGRGEVAGAVMMLKGANSSRVIKICEGAYLTNPENHADVVINSWTVRKW